MKNSTYNLKTLIANGMEEEAIEILINAIERSGNNSILNDILFISNQLKNYKNRENLGLPINIDKKNELIYSLINLITSFNSNDNIKSEDFRTSFSKKRRKKNFTITFSVSMVSICLVSFILGANFIGIILLIILFSTFVLVKAELFN